MSDQGFLLSWLYCLWGEGVGSSYEYFIFVFAVFCLKQDSSGWNTLFNIVLSQSTQICKGDIWSYHYLVHPQEMFFGRITLSRWQTSVRNIQFHTEKNTKKSSEINPNVCFLEEVKEGLQMFDRIYRFHGFISTLTHRSHMVICLVWDLLEGGYILVSLPADWFPEISAHHFSASLLSVR